jgi:hypothetical protein
VQHVDELAVEFDGLGRREFRGRSIGVDVAADCRDGRDRSECVEDGDVADIARVQDVRGAAECAEGFGAKQAVGVGDDAERA